MNPNSPEDFEITQGSAPVVDSDSSQETEAVEGSVENQTATDAEMMYPSAKTAEQLADITSEVVMMVRAHNLSDSDAELVYLASLDTHKAAANYEKEGKKDVNS